MINKHAVIYILFLVFGCKCLIYEVNFETPFPVYEDEKINLRFTSDGKEIPKSKWIAIRIVDQHSEKQSFAFNPYHNTSIMHKGNRSYFQVYNHTINEESDVVLSLSFYRTSNNKNMEVYFISTKHDDESIKLLDNLNNYANYQLSAITISLNIHWDFVFSQQVNSSISGGLLAGKKGFIVCRAVNGVPFAPVKILGLEYLNVIKKSFDNRRNLEIAEIAGRLEDDKRPIFCRANEDTYYTQLRIFHESSKLIFEPKIDGYVQHSTQINCFVKNGYPEPPVFWTFLSGPANASEFYNINNVSGNKGLLIINKLAPLGSKWRFICGTRFENETRLNRVHSQRALSTIVEFEIGEAPVFTRAFIMKLVASLFAVLAALAILAFIIRHFRQKGGHNHGHNDYQMCSIDDTKRQAVLKGKESYPVNVV